MRKMPNFLSVIRSKVPKHFTQVLATLAVSLGPFSAGLGKGYSSPALASLQESKTSSFPVNAQEGSWVASLQLLGALFGCLFGGVMLNLGRRKTILIVALPFAGSWLLTVFAQRVEMMYSTSFIGGFFSAVILLATQVYVSEISHPEIRGCLSALLKMAGHLGTLSSYALGAFLDWRQLATVAAGAPILFFLAILPIPETPSFLLFNGREEEASKSLAWLRSNDEDVNEEIETLKTNILNKEKKFFPTRSSMKSLMQPLFVTCGLMFFHKFSGVTVFFHYAVPIFRQVFETSRSNSTLSCFTNEYSNTSIVVFGRNLNPHGAAIVVAFLQLLGSMTSGLLIDTAGRLPLLTLSNLFISGSFFGFGLYNWMEESLPPSHPGFGPSLDWIPLTCVLFFTLFFSIGIGPISWLMVSELFPLEYRGFGGAVSTSFSYACAFAAVKSYVDIQSRIGLYGAFWIYSGLSIGGLIFVCCAVPETKGVELEEMAHHLQSSTTNSTTTVANNSITHNSSGHLNTSAPSNRENVDGLNNLKVPNTIMKHQNNHHNHDNYSNAAANNININSMPLIPTANIVINNFNNTSNHHHVNNAHQYPPPPLHNHHLLRQYSSHNQQHYQYMPDLDLDRDQLELEYSSGNNRIQLNNYDDPSLHSPKFLPIMNHHNQHHNQFNNLQEYNNTNNILNYRQLSLNKKNNKGAVTMV